MGKLKDAHNKIERILKDRETELKDLEEQIRKTKKLISKATTDIEEAEKRSDPELYKLASKEKDETETVLKMYENRKAALTAKPLIDAEEYKALAGMIKDEVHKQEDKAIERMLDICEELETLAGELQALQEDANKELRILQTQIYRNQDRTKNAKGVILNLSFEELKVDVFSTINWLKSPLKEKAYKLKGAKHGTKL